MADLTRPQLLNIDSFDVSDGQIFKYIIPTQSQIGVSIETTRLIIVDNETGNEVYNNTKPTGQIYQYQLEPNASGLVNGKSYNAVVQYITSDFSESPQSNQIFFYCLSKPTLVIDGFTYGQANPINSSGFDFIVNYSQDEGEKLNTLVYNLYSIDNVLMATSGTIYTGGLNVNSYTFNGFDDEMHYYIEVIGKTEHNMPCRTPLYELVVDYIRPSVFSVLELNNVCDGGYINVKSNIVDIEGRTYSGEPPIYIDDTKVDLKNDGVIWDKGFQLNGDFTLSAWVENITDYMSPELITLKLDDNNKIMLQHRKEEDRYTYIDMYVYNDYDVTYYIVSNPLDSLQPSDKMFIWLRRVGNIYELKISILTE